MSRRLSLHMFLHFSWWACVRLVRRCGFVFANAFLDACRTIDFFVQRHACFCHWFTTGPFAHHAVCVHRPSGWAFCLYRGSLLTQMMRTLTSLTSGVRRSTIHVRSVMLGSLVAGGGEFSRCHQISMTFSTCTCVTSITWIWIQMSNESCKCENWK